MITKMDVKKSCRPLYCQISLYAYYRRSDWFHLSKELMSIINAYRTLSFAELSWFWHAAHALGSLINKSYFIDGTTTRHRKRYAMTGIISRLEIKTFIWDSITKPLLTVSTVLRMICNNKSTSAHKLAFYTILLHWFGTAVQVVDAPYEYMKDTVCFFTQNWSSLTVPILSEN